MNEVILEKLYNFMDELEKSDLVTMLEKSKIEMKENKKVQELLKKYNESKENRENIQKAKTILYSNEKVKQYLKYENELNYLIIDLNSILNKLIDKKGCR